MTVRRSEEGFTLIETVLFIVILGVVLGVLVPFSAALKKSPVPVAEQQAVALAQGELDQTIAQRHAAGFAPVGTGACVLPMPATFSCSRTVCFVPASDLNDTSACGGATRYKRVQVTITNALIGNVTAVTLLANY